jgi:hypothetical protein
MINNNLQTISILYKLTQWHKHRYHNHIEAKVKEIRSRLVR